MRERVLESEWVREGRVGVRESEWVRERGGEWESKRD